MGTDIANGKGKKAKCLDCRKSLGFKDYICVIDPYSCTETRERPLRVNLCIKCYDERVEKVARIARGESAPLPESEDTTREIMQAIEDEIANVPVEQRPNSKNRRKKKRLEKRKRRELINKRKENNEVNTV